MLLTDGTGKGLYTYIFAEIFVNNFFYFKTYTVGVILCYSNLSKFYPSFSLRFTEDPANPSLDPVRMYDIDGDHFFLFTTLDIELIDLYREAYHASLHGNAGSKWLNLYM